MHRKKANAIKVVPATSEHGSQISKLATSIDSTGSSFGVRMHLLKDAYTVFTRHPKSRGLVALTTEDRVIGYHFSRPLTVLINDVPIQSTFGFNLAVHPDFRRQGIGSKIVRTYQNNCISSGIQFSVELLKEWFGQTCKGCRRRLYAAKDSKGNMLAGLGVDDCSQLFTWIIFGVPWPARVLGHLLKIADKEGRIPYAKVILLWYQNGEAVAARRLWEWIRWDLRRDVRLLVIYYDPLSPVRKAVRSSVYLPKTKSIRFARVFGDIHINSPRPIGTEFI